MSTRDLEVRVMRAEGLPAANVVNALSDPYAVLRHVRGGAAVSPPLRPANRSRKCANTLAPRWYESFFIDAARPGDALVVEVWDFNNVRPDCCLGSVEVDLAAALAASARARVQSLPPLPPPPSYPARSTGPALATRNRGYAAAAREHSHAHANQGYAPGPPPPPLPPGFPPGYVVHHYPPGYVVHHYPPGYVVHHYPPGYDPHHYPPAPSGAPPAHAAPGYAPCLAAGAGAAVAASWGAGGAERAGAAEQQRLGVRHALNPQGAVVLAVVDRSEFAGLCVVAPGLPFQRFVNHQLGAALTDAGALSEHATWKVDVAHVAEVFADVPLQGWNRDYAAAKRIFAGPLACVAQQALVAQHSFLYGGVLKEVRKGLAQTTGTLLSGEDFVAVTGAGERKGKPRMFTYVIMPRSAEHPARLYFAETGAKFLQDMNSKHAMHSNAAKKVLYAGEFHFRKGQHPGEPPLRLIVDNNSGTYAPDKALLPKVRELFERNFEGLPVETFDFQDPKLKAYTSSIARSESTEMV